MNVRKHANVMAILLVTTVLAGPAFAIGAPFTDIDSDADDKLSKQELVDFFGAESAERTLKAHDKDDNGSISWEEAVNAEATRHSDEMRADMDDLQLEDVDMDDNGEVSWEELTSIFGEEDAAEIMELLINDADGSVTEVELVEAIALALLDEEAEEIDDDGTIYLDDADMDGNGDLTKQELVDHFGEETTADILTDLDRDKDGTVTDAEFEQAAVAAMESDEDDEELDLYAVDLDADGKITKEELEAFIGDDATIALQELDDDNDGAISMAELDAIYDESDLDMDDDDGSEAGDNGTDGDIDLTDDELALAVSQAIVDIVTEELESLNEGSVSDTVSNDADMDAAEDDAWNDDGSWDDEDSFDDDSEMDDSDQF